MSSPCDVMTVCQGSASLKRTVFGVTFEKRIFATLLTTQVSAPSDLLRITSVVLFTPPDPYTRDQTPEDDGLGKRTLLATGAQ
jgi:hypothetical protein